ncbi:unnamed protein product [Clonostachys byssicola]|uniref:BZIP domain-containing protein n=1 Tax=Clonostachys byssicola TaxID=160290 RepID=A0A9N9UA05_9HYPO|nr:unnamed protein product [Clonostachys byssicola]
MDFSQQYQYAGGPSHQPFMPVSPPIANASQSSSEEYNNDSSPVSTKISPLYITPPVTPPVMVPHRETKLYEPPASDFLPTYRFGHNFQQQQGSNFGGIVGSNSPMMPSSSAGKTSFMQHHQHAQASYDSSSASYQGHALALRGSLRGQPPSLDTDDQSVGVGGDDMIMTKRKAQNRAAQRAFRERKEKHVKDLETTLNELRESQEKATSENEKLKKDLQKITTENLILRASKGSDDYTSTEVLVTGPTLQQLNNSAFASDTLPSLNIKVSHRVVEAPDGTRLLAAGAAWDYIVSHPQYQTGLVDISSVSDYLMKNPSYDGQGPVFSEKDINDAIERSMTEGSDDLL